MSHRPRKRFGQNFLQDPLVIERILQALRVQRDDHVIEVGPGLGALTLPLIGQLNTLTVIEIDRDLIARLQARQLEGLQIINGDVLQVDWAQLHEEQRLRIVGNLPYNIGTPLLLRLIDVYPLLQDVHVMLQKEVVDRLSATCGSRSFGRLSVLAQSVFNVTPLFKVPASAFEPCPKVESAVVRLQTREDAISVHTINALKNATRLAFANKRKTLWNNLKTHLSTGDLERLGIDPQARAESLDVAAFLRLASFLDHD